MSFLNLENKTFAVFGVANKKSVAFQAAQVLWREKANVVLVVRSEKRKEEVKSIAPQGTDIFVCDVENEEQIELVAKSIAAKHPVIHGLVHSIAFADFSDGQKPFHETKKSKFLQTVDVSCFSLIAISNAFREFLEKNASVVTISISTTEMASENYGWMAPAKAALESAVCFLAKSFSSFSQVRFNAVCPGLLKTSASAGIPGYLESYLFAEKCTLRGKGVETSEVANTVAFLLSEASSGITAQRLVIDAGMRLNYFDREIIEAVTKIE